MRWLVVLVLLVGTARADTSWHAGLNLRADLGTHPMRIGGGIQLGRVDTMLVVDPMFWTGSDRHRCARVLGALIVNTSEARVMRRWLDR